MTGDVATLLGGIVDTAPDAVLVVDVAGTVVLANRACGIVFGQQPEQMVGTPVVRFVPERLRDQHAEHHARYLADPTARPIGLRRLSALRADGAEFPAEVSLASIDAGGRHYVCATVRDLSDRLQDEELFRGLLEAAPDATVIVDAYGSIVMINNRMHEVLGYEPADLVGRSLATLAGVPGPEEILERLMRYLKAPASVPMGYSREFWVVHRDGHHVPVELSLAPLETPEGVLVSIAVRDASERLRLEAESQRLRDELIATVSHELRTPLTSIIGYTELMGDLGEPDLSPRGRRMLQVIQRNASRELRLVDDLLTMAYLDTDRIQLELASVDLGTVGRTVVDDQALRAGEAGIDLVFAGGVARINGDFARMVQVVENLVANALKFTLRGGRVDVCVTQLDGMGVIEIRDTGIGVPAEEQARLFDRLYRAPEAIANQVPGAGLGLSIVRAIVEAHEGRIDLQSEVGIGTIVRVAIPLDRERVDATPAG